MPDPLERKVRKKALERVKKKYLECPTTQSPLNIFPAIRKLTDMLRTLMNTKNYIRLLTQLDLNQYIMQQHYIYCDNDLWVTGEALVMNVNPDKKIYMRTLCSKTKTDCIAYDEHSHNYISICPNCGKVVQMIKATPFKCPHCKYRLSWKDTNRMPYAKISCEWCPLEIGWDKAQEMRDLVRNKLKVRSEVIKEKMNEDFDKVEGLAG